MIGSENRLPLFRIMRYDNSASPLTAKAEAGFMNLPACGLIPLL
jgi:hypothetical protein